MIYYRQCRLRTKPFEDGTYREQVAWIPEKHSTVGNMVYFGKKTDNPEILWEVLSIGHRQTEDYIKAHEQDYKNQRKASDI